MQTVSIFDIPFHPLSRTSVIEEVRKLLQTEGQHIVVTPNPEMLLESLRNPKLKAILQQASLSLPDGIGILWASKFLSLPRRGKFRTLLQWKLSLLSILFHPSYIRTVLPERVTGSDTFLKVIEQLNYSYFLLGGEEKVAESVKKYLEEKNPRVRIVGTYAGQPFTSDDQVILEKINAAQPEFLFVAFGAPKQELWMQENLAKMPSVKVAMGIGGSFDFIAGTVKRAPLLFQKLGIEWLWRLFQEPKKRLPRIWNAVVVFPVKVLKYKLTQD